MDRRYLSQRDPCCFSPLPFRLCCISFSPSSLPPFFRCSCLHNTLIYLTIVLHNQSPARAHRPTTFPHHWPWHWHVVRWHLGFIFWNPHCDWLALPLISCLYLPALSTAIISASSILSLGANPYLPTRYVLSSLWALNQNTQHGPTRSI